MTNTDAHAHICNVTRNAPPRYPPHLLSPALFSPYLSSPPSPTSRRRLPIFSNYFFRLLLTLYKLTETISRIDFSKKHSGAAMLFNHTRFSISTGTTVINTPLRYLPFKVISLNNLLPISLAFIVLSAYAE